VFSFLSEVSSADVPAILIAAKTFNKEAAFETTFISYY